MSNAIPGQQNKYFGLKPAKIDKHGPAFLEKHVIEMCMNMILTETFFEKKAKTMTTDAEKAIEKTEKVTKEFAATLDKFHCVERNFAEQSKRAAGNVRDAIEKLANGLAKIEKAANFDRLEKYVNLLERAAKAMETLAELESSGKLEKIAVAIR